MACPVVHANQDMARGAPAEQPGTKAHARAEALCAPAAQRTDECRARVVDLEEKGGTGDCAKEAGALLRCERRRRELVRSVTGHGNMLFAVDDCIESGTREDECRSKAEAWVNEVDRKLGSPLDGKGL